MKLLRSIRRLYRSLRHGLKFKEGYEYQRYRTKFIEVLKMHDEIMRKEGWKKAKDLHIGRYLTIWYMRPIKE